ncbi:MAG: HNH endonuclease [Thermoguttaceae bacterium]
MDNALRSLVRRRAGDVCEYCRLPQTASRFVQFHVEHIVARQHGGATESDNLALACGFCNFHKRPNIASLDPKSGELVPVSGGGELSQFAGQRGVWPAVVGGG